ncbi:DUF4868 domain-containing protein [Candidatus Saccharibacteria bacterium]|nr:DUF4868 domain-containing protein [Candidatus Saccharibacteria bacterium]
MQENQLTPEQTEPQITTTPEESSLDPFLWANQTDAIKNDLKIELFLFNKNYTPYKVRFADNLTTQIRSLFLFDTINFINSGTGTGLSVREYELSDGEENVFYRTELKKVDRAETLVHLLEHEYKDIEFFSEQDYDFKRIKGIIAKFSLDNKHFYIAKQIAQSQVLKSTLSWELRGETFEPFSSDIGVKIPADNQVAIIGTDIFIFNQSKFEKLFNYDFKSQLVADEKAKKIAELYKLSFAEGLTLDNLLQEKKGLVKKLQKIEPGEITQKQVIEYADEMSLELMTDETDSIIIMDGNDLGMFINLLSEDYIVSNITGKRYEIKSKKLLSDPEGEPPRG